MPTEKDYYKILEVDATATPEQIKAAYREMAKKFHPDAVGASQGNADRFRDIQQAYQVLATKESRVSYDLDRKRNPNNYSEMSETDFA